MPLNERGSSERLQGPAWLSDWAALALGTHEERTDSQAVAPTRTLPCVLALPRPSGRQEEPELVGRAQVLSSSRTCASPGGWSVSCARVAFSSGSSGGVRAVVADLEDCITSQWAAPWQARTPSFPGLLPKLSWFLTSPTPKLATLLLFFLSFHGDEINPGGPSLCPPPATGCPMRTFISTSPGAV